MFIEAILLDIALILNTFATALLITINISKDLLASIMGYAAGS
jgi:hypothetical protein